jgi:hypothetical protein
MRTISIEIEDSAYKTVVDFLKLLPKNLFTIYDDSIIADEEKKEIKRLNKMIDEGNLSEFRDFDEL